jgi:hypothetical protein
MSDRPSRVHFSIVLTIQRKLIAKTLDLVLRFSFLHALLMSAQQVRQKIANKLGAKEFKRPSQGHSNSRAEPRKTPTTNPMA